jgi:uncharacterized protein (DUF1501 family)
MLRSLALAGGGLVLAAPGARLALAAAGAPLATRADGQRLVVVMLRGALDGLAAVPPVGDPAFALLRPASSAVPGGGAASAPPGAPLPLDGLFALHPALATLHRWYGDGELAVLHAVASPYRDRSHFDAQQLLESGGTRPFELSTGWLGRALQAGNRQAVALTPSLPVALRGADGASSWAPTRLKPADDDLLERLAQVYAADPALESAFSRARSQRQGVMGEAAAGERGAAGFVDLARQAGRFLAAPDGPPVAWLESSGWDTHTQQVGRLARLLPVLDQGLAALRDALGERWRSTVVLVVTEFGRSAALNGSGGTDHGTAGAAFLAGGAVRGGRVIADWPGLAARDLHEGRDLRPTLDLRAVIKPIVERQLGVDRSQLEREVLPSAPPGLGDLWRT